MLLSTELCAHDTDGAPMVQYASLTPGSLKWTFLTVVVKISLDFSLDDIAKQVCIKTGGQKVC